MSLVNIIMPKLGESIMEATVLKWHKKVGDAVSLDETLLDIATDKVDSEVPSTAAGVLEEILCKENDVISIGSVIGKIRTSTPEPSVVAAPSFAPVHSSQNGTAANGITQKQEEISCSKQTGSWKIFLSIGHEHCLQRGNSLLRTGTHQGFWQ
jgi:2-oxoglutarate dehydrogenase E2 component (dihydrolipoamide succinyltransferase)